MECEVSLLCL